MSQAKKFTIGIIPIPRGYVDITDAHFNVSRGYTLVVKKHFEGILGMFSVGISKSPTYQAKTIANTQTTGILSGMLILGPCHSLRPFMGVGFIFL